MASPIPTPTVPAVNTLSVDELCAELLKFDAGGGVFVRGRAGRIPTKPILSVQRHPSNTQRIEILLDDRNDA